MIKLKLYYVHTKDEIGNYYEDYWYAASAQEAVNATRKQYKTRDVIKVLETTLNWT